MPGTQLLDPVSGEEVPKVDNAIAVGEDLRFQERWWTFERIIWSVFLLIVLADVLGVFGRGWLSKAELHGDGTGMDVKYERVERAMTPSVMTIDFRPEALHDGKVELFVSDTLVKELGTQRVIPQPERSVVGNGGITYTFPASGLPAEIQLEMQPSFPGVHSFGLQVPGMQSTGARISVVP